jgi:hypothetical protein
MNACPSCPKEWRGVAEGYSVGAKTLLDSFSGGGFWGFG